MADPANARYVVIQFDGKVRYVESNLFARDFDVAYGINVAPDVSGRPQTMRHWSDRR